jgi:hypothetical protein
MGFEELLKVAKTTNEKIDGTVRQQIEKITSGKQDPEFHIEQFLYEVLVTMWVEKNLIEQIELGIQQIKKEEQAQTE